MTPANSLAIALQRIVSGGQTGVDRGALDAALDLHIPHGGWCPRGRRAEDGRIPSRYRLREMPSSDYARRTEQNVLDSDATLILYGGALTGPALTGGTALTHRLCLRHGRPHLVLDPTHDDALATARAWLAEHHVHVLNVAGPRESSFPGIGQMTRQFIARLLESEMEQPQEPRAV